MCAHQDTHTHFERTTTKLLARAPSCRSLLHGIYLPLEPRPVVGEPMQEILSQLIEAKQIKKTRSLCTFYHRSACSIEECGNILCLRRYLHHSAYRKLIERSVSIWSAHATRTTHKWSFSNCISLVYALKTQTGHYWLVFNNPRVFSFYTLELIFR